MGIIDKRVMDGFCQKWIQPVLVRSFKIPAQQLWGSKRDGIGGHVADTVAPFMRGNLPQTGSQQPSFLHYSYFWGGIGFNSK